MTALLELKDVTKRFGGLQAVGHMTFSLNKGEILGLIGPNGAGKTTIFNLINGFYAPTSGTILFILVSEIFRVWVGSGHLLFFGVLIIAIIIYFPNGIVGTLADRRARKRRLKGAEAAA